MRGYWKDRTSVSLLLLENLGLHKPYRELALLVCPDSVVLLRSDSDVDLSTITRIGRSSL